MSEKNIHIIANFGGPRSLDEVEEFLICLFKDREVLRTSLPPFLHNYIFTRLAKKRALLVKRDYAEIGGKSPIYEDTEQIAQHISQVLDMPVFTFHRYLPETHASFLEAMHQLPDDIAIRVFPLFPQFSYATTGSIAKWFVRQLDARIIRQMTWIKSYPAHPAYVAACVACIKQFLCAHNVREENTILLFSAHGLPQEFIRTGDVYERECQLTYHQLASHFPHARLLLSYQSQLGKKEWIKPYTSDMCRTIDAWGKGYDTVVTIPLSFTSDHIETLYEVEKLYLPLIAEHGFRALRCPALNQRRDWLAAIAEIMTKEAGVATPELLRQK